MQIEGFLQVEPAAEAVSVAAVHVRRPAARELDLKERELLKPCESLREHLCKKKMFSFGHCPNEGGGRTLPELKNTLYIFIFDGRKRCTSCPKWGGGEVIRAMPERKHSFFKEVFP